MKKVFIIYRRFPEKIRIVFTALLGLVIGFITYEIVFFLNPITPKASTSWFISFIIGVARQHCLHRNLTFRHKTPYWKSLFRAYVMYAGSLIIGSGLNWLLTEILLIHHRIAWGCCLIVTALISLAFLKRFVFKAS